MPSVYDLKPAFQGLLRPLVRSAVRAGLTPNQMTLAALLGSIAIGAILCAARDRPFLLILLPLWLFARMALNAMDGMAAREHGLESRSGAVLNELGDVLSDVALYLPLAFLTPSMVWPVIAFTLGALLTEFSGVLGQALGARRHYEGPMGKSDRAFVIGTMALVAAFAGQTLRYWPPILWLLAALTLLTCANRLRGALREMPEARS